MSTDKDIFKTMMDFALEAGDVAMKFWDKAKAGLKADRSVITEADKTISRMVHKKLSRYLKDPNHILIDEEDPDVARFQNLNTLKRAKYVWSVDPIDGTRNYANHIPSFAVSIGILKDLKPWMGAVYFPAFGELLFHYGKKAVFVRHPGTKNEKRKTITPVDVEISSKTYFLATDVFFKKFDWDHKDCRVQIQSCAAVEMCWPALGRCCGSLTKSSLWDFAGSWPIIRAAGLDMRSMSTGQKLDRLDLNCFSREIPWRLKDFYIISSAKNFLTFKNKISQNK